MRRPSRRVTSSTYSTILYNYDLSNDEILSHYQSGISEDNKWGSQVSIYSSDFSI